MHVSIEPGNKYYAWVLLQGARAFRTTPARAAGLEAALSTEAGQAAFKEARDQFNRLETSAQVEGWDVT